MVFVKAAVAKAKAAAAARADKPEMEKVQAMEKEDVRGEVPEMSGDVRGCGDRATAGTRSYGYNALGRLTGDTAWAGCSHLLAMS